VVFNASPGIVEAAGAALEGGGGGSGRASSSLSAAPRAVRPLHREVAVRSGRSQLRRAASLVRSSSLSDSVDAVGDGAAKPAGTVASCLPMLAGGCRLGATSARACLAAMSHAARTARTRPDRRVRVAVGRTRACTLRQSLCTMRYQPSAPVNPSSRLPPMATC